MASTRSDKWGSSQLNLFFVILLAFRESDTEKTWMVAVAFLKRKWIKSNEIIVIVSEPYDSSNWDKDEKWSQESPDKKNDERRDDEHNEEHDDAEGLLLVRGHQLAFYNCTGQQDEQKSMILEQ